MKPLGSCPHPCIKIYHAVNHSDKCGERTMALSHQFWQISFRFFHMFLWFLTFTGIYPPLNTGCMVIREYFHFSPQMWTVCDSHVTPAHVRILPPWAHGSHAKQIFALTPNYTTPSICGNRKYIMYEWRQIPVLCSSSAVLLQRKTIYFEVLSSL